MFQVSEDEAGRASWEIREPTEGDDGQRSQGHLSK